MRWVEHFEENLPLNVTDPNRIRYASWGEKDEWGGAGAIWSRERLSSCASRTSFQTLQMLTVGFPESRYGYHHGDSGSHSVHSVGKRFSLEYLNELGEFRLAGERPVLFKEAIGVIDALLQILNMASCLRRGIHFSRCAGEAAGGKVGKCED